MAAILFWSCVALVFYAYVAYPCALMILAAARPRSVQKAARFDAATVRIVKEPEAAILQWFTIERISVPLPRFAGI